MEDFDSPPSPSPAPVVVNMLENNIDETKLARAVETGMVAANAPFSKLRLKAEDKERFLSNRAERERKKEHKAITKKFDELIKAVSEGGDGGGLGLPFGQGKGKSPINGRAAPVRGRTPRGRGKLGALLGAGAALVGGTAIGYGALGDSFSEPTPASSLVNATPQTSPVRATPAPSSRPVSSLAKGLVKSARNVPVLGTAVGGYMMYSDIDEVNQQVKDGQITERDAKLERAKAVGGGAGSMAGGAIGATIGSLLGPAGTIGGGIAGAAIGDTIGQYGGEAYDYLFNGDKEAKAPASGENVTGSPADKVADTFTSSGSVQEQTNTGSKPSSDAGSSLLGSLSALAALAMNTGESLAAQASSLLNGVSDTKSVTAPEAKLDSALSSIGENTKSSPAGGLTSLSTFGQGSEEGIPVRVINSVGVYAASDFLESNESRVGVHDKELYDLMLLIAMNGGSLAEGAVPLAMGGGVVSGGGGGGLSGEGRSGGGGGFNPGLSGGADVPRFGGSAVNENAKGGGARRSGKEAKAAEQSLIKYAQEQGLEGKELQHFMGQTAHESGGFVYKRELASGEAYEGRVQSLGNTQAGDGVRFKGRGHIQITGRANYEKYGKMIGQDLINNPELAEDPEIANQLAVAYWKDRVRPKMGSAENPDFDGISQAINGGRYGQSNGRTDRLVKTGQYADLANKKAPAIEPTEPTAPGGEEKAPAPLAPLTVQEEKPVVPVETSKPVTPISAPVGATAPQLMPTGFVSDDKAPTLVPDVKPVGEKSNINTVLSSILGSKELDFTGTLGKLGVSDNAESLFNGTIGGIAGGKMPGFELPKLGDVSPFQMINSKFDMSSVTDQLQGVAGSIGNLASPGGNGAVQSSVKGPPSIADIPLDEAAMNLLNAGGM